MHYLPKILLLLSLATFTLLADIQVIAKASKNKKALYRDKEFLENLLPDAQVQIIRSSHPIWKWRVGVTAIKQEDRAQEILKIIRESYYDAYILHANKVDKPYTSKKAYKRKKQTFIPKDETVEINFSDLTIVDFIKMVSKITHKNILIPKKIEGTINFIGVQPIKESKLLPLLNQILLSNDFTLQDTNNGFLKIVKSSEAIKNAPPIFGTSDLDDMQTAVLPFKNLKAIDIMKQAKSLVSKYGKISAANGNNSLIVTDFPENIKSIKNIIALLDKNSDTTVKFITFKNTDVKSIYTKVKKMVQSFFNRRSKSQQIQLVKSENANSLALIGDKRDIAKIMPYVKALDKGVNRKEKNIELVYIKNTDAESVAKLLSNLISDKNFNENLEHMSDLNKAPVPDKSDTKKPILKQKRERSQSEISENRPNITFDKQLNAVMIFGTVKEREVLKGIITKLDVERKQVYVKARILEINNDKASQIGIQYGIVGGISDSTGLYALSNKMGIDDAGVGLNLASSLGLTIPNVKKVLALGAAVSLLKENKAANILSEPSILCINNEESSLYVGETISVISQTSIASTTTDINRNIYNREDIGLTLKIRPRISADHKVALGVEVSSEDILPGSPVGLPKTTKRVVKTSAIVKNGETIIIGGMVRDKESKNINGIPILSNIPILGKVFKHESVGHDKTTLVLMLTPYIIEHSANLSKLRQDLGKLYTFEQTYAQHIR